MSTSVYTINKGINRAMEFKGLKAQYIWWLGGGLLLLLILFAVLYIAGVNPFICLALIIFLSTGLFIHVYRISRRYGEHGMMKELAKRSVPSVIKVRTRNTFLSLCKKK